MSTKSGLGTVWQDVRFGARLLGRSPGFATFAILILALGIGTASAAFVVAYAVFLRPWPGRDPSSLVKIYQRWHGIQEDGLSWAERADIERGAPALSGVLGYERHACQIRASHDAPLTLDDWVSRNYFSVLRLGMFLGRGFSAKPESQPTVIIGYDIWRGEFDGSPKIIGKSILISGRHFIVVGVAPRGFYGLSRFVRTHLWFPADEWMSPKELADHSWNSAELRARVGAREPIAAVRSQLAAIGAHEAAAFPATNKDTTLSAETLAEREKSSRPSFLMLLAPAALVLLIACANVAGLLLARAEGRRREIAIRLALGATRLRLVRQMLTESSLLALPAAGLGLLFVRWLMMLEPALMPPSSIQIGGPILRLDLPALGFALVVTVASVVLFGLTPALGSRKGDLASAGKGGASVALASGGKKIRRSALVVVQIALATTLLVASGLLLRSFLYSNSINPGFDVHGHRWIFDVGLAGGLNPQAVRKEYAALFKLPNGRAAAMTLLEKAMQTERTSVRARVLALPGVRGAAWCQRVPLSDSGGGTQVTVAVPDATLPETRAPTQILYNAAGVGYFRLAGTRLLAGRSFASTDAADSQPVAVVSEAFARRYWPGESPLGRELVVSGKRTIVVGLAQDVKVNSLHETPRPYLYFPLAQRVWGNPMLIVHTAARGGPSALTMRDAMRAVDPGISFYGIKPVQQLMSQVLWQERMESNFAGAVAGIGILLAAVGLFALVDYSVRRRTPEFGVRMAIGAQPSDILAVVFRMGLWLSFAGCALGLGGGFAVALLLRSSLYGISPDDPFTYVSVAALLAVVTLAATFLPARRATRVDPATALRWE